MTDVASRPLTIGMVAGEPSGDNLGAPLVRQLQQLAPGSTFVGVGGPNMITEGFRSLADMDRLSVNGFVDPLMRLPDLLRLLLQIRDAVVESEADCFVGIDFNFFNLLLEGMLKKRGIKTVHYVSPTVWAWRQGRINKISRNTDLMLTLYPFETAIYEEHGIPVTFVGHPKALEIDLDEGPASQSDAREKLGLAGDACVVAILPGSRSREVEMTGRDFLETAARLSHRVDAFVIPAANAKRREQIETLLFEYEELRSVTTVVDGDSRLAMTAADLVLVNSGTATLEAMLLKKPMVMSYRVGKLTYAIASRLLKIDRFALPNILADADLVPEFIQDAANPDSMAEAALALLDETRHERLLDTFDGIHRTLRQNEEPGVEAAKRIIRFCG